MGYIYGNPKHLKQMILSVILAGLLQLAGIENTGLGCGANLQAQELALLIIGHESQQRAELQCNELLAEIAAQRAIDLIKGSKPDDLTPNQILIENGFKFPSFYPPVGNQVQAVASEAETPASALEYLVGSYAHRDLVLGDGEFFSRQSQMGVGYYKNEHNQTQYVVLIAEPYSSPKLVIEQEFKAPVTTMDENCGKTWRHSKNNEFRKECRERWLKKKDEN